MLGGLTLLAAVLRFATLDLQSLWSDEAVTILLTRMDFTDMLRTISETESTPPFYYVVAWAWVRVFGDGEIGLRSLSALAGTMLVPVAYFAGRSLVGRRSGIATGAVVAVSPILVWYSQEARSYMLAVLLCGISFAAFVLVTRGPTTTSLAVWVMASALAIGTHYFALFLIGAECVWLLATRRPPSVVKGVAGVALVGGALIPLALKQRSHGFAEFVGDADGLAFRTVVIGKQLLVGPEIRGGRVLAAGAAILLTVSIAFLATRRGVVARRAVAVAAAVGASAVVLPLRRATVGLDYVNTRNLLMGFVPMAIVLTVGLAVVASPPLGAAALTLLAGILLTASLVITLDPGSQRPNWRGLVREIGEPDIRRAVVVTPDHQGWFARVALEIYLPEARALDGAYSSTPPAFTRLSRRVVDDSSPRRVVTREVVLAGVGWSLPELSERLPRTFRRVEARSGIGYSFVRYRSARPVSIETATLAAPQSAVILVEPSTSGS